MPDDVQTTTIPTPDPIIPAPTDAAEINPVVSPTVPENSPISSEPAPENPETPLADLAANTEIISEVANKIAEAHNILIALSADPSVDEISAAIGLSLCLDRLGKRATAIYSGSTPNALEFLKPEETFESTADTLQDFVVALNKDKADHLRYKLDGDFVKIYITPYKTRISEEDLEFSYGDFNVDLVLALDVANGVDLDAALREHGRIMHDAVVVNITTGNPGKLGEIEWSDKTASSVSEMIARLLYGINKMGLEKEEATAFLTGIVAATNRFSKANTTSETMKIASRLMESGADQQLISKNITPDIENELFSFVQTAERKREDDNDPTKLSIEHGEISDETKDEAPETESETPEETEDSALLNDLKATEEILSHTGAETTPERVEEPLRLDSSSMDLAPDANELSADAEASNQAAVSSFLAEKPEKVIAPSEEFIGGPIGEGSNKYGQMLEEALAESNNPVEPTAPIITQPEQAPVVDTNPAASVAPAINNAPEINGVPEINYMPMPGEEILPPPPTPPVDFSAPVESAPQPAPQPEESAPVAQQPVDTQPNVETQPAPDVQSAAPIPDVQPAPDTFKIPGM